MYQPLSRLEITGELYDPPNCVIVEIAEAHGIPLDLENLRLSSYRSMVLTTIRNRATPDVRYSTVQEKVRFVNADPCLRWRNSQIQKAVDYLFSFRDAPDKLAFVGSNFIVGKQTPTNHTLTNYCMLYRICIINGIPVSHQTSSLAMESSVRYLFMSETALRGLLHERFMSLTTTDIVATLSRSHPGAPHTAAQRVASDCPVGHSDLQRVYTEILNTEELQKRCTPINNIEAIAFAAFSFEIDISAAENPIGQYLELQRLSLGSRGTGVPPVVPLGTGSPRGTGAPPGGTGAPSGVPHRLDLNDTKLKVITRINPNLLNLAKFFNPLFPVEYYSEATINELFTLEYGPRPEQAPVATFFGVVINQARDEPTIASKYQDLQIAYLMETFHAGFHPNTINTETAIDLTPIASLRNEEVVSFGVRGAPAMYCISYRELATMFLELKYFSNPFVTEGEHCGRVLFTTAMIDKLLRITEIDPNGHKNNLHQSIMAVRQYIKLEEERSLDIVRRYRESSPEQRQDIESALRALLNVGMYMRGWTGEWSGRYTFPTTTGRGTSLTETITPYGAAVAGISVETPEQQYEINRRVTMGLEELRRSAEKLVPRCNFLDLALWEFRTARTFSASDTGYIKCRDPKDGLTIRGRIAIIGQGEHPDAPIESCIRMSSNWLCATAAYYMGKIGMTVPFNITSLRQIS